MGKAKDYVFTFARALATIEKQFDSEGRKKHPAITTGFRDLDSALGTRGLPCGGIIEVFGPPLSGKTMLALHAIATMQKQGVTAAFIDSEHDFDINYAVALGVQLDNLLVSQPATVEQALGITEVLIRSGVVDLVVVNSIDALAPRVVIKGKKCRDERVKLQKYTFRRVLEKLSGYLKHRIATVCFINQTRPDIGVILDNISGEILKFYATVRLGLCRVGAINKGTGAPRDYIRVKVVKNKFVSLFHTVELDYIAG